MKNFSIVLGEVVAEEKIKDLPLKKISLVLKDNGFELIEDSKAKTIELLKKKLSL